MNTKNMSLLFIRAMLENEVPPVPQTVSIKSGDLMFSHSWQACEQVRERESKTDLTTLLSPVQECFDADGNALSPNNVWTKFYLHTPVVVKRIAFAHAPHTINFRKVTFQGSNDDNAWATLLSLTNETVDIGKDAPPVWCFEFNNNTAYKYYRCVINEILTEGLGHSDVLQYPIWGGFILENSTVTVTGVSIESALLNIKIGRTHELDFETQPKNAANNSILWSSSNPTVAAVNSNGVVTAKNIGTAVITVRAASDASIFDTCLVVVLEEDPDEIDADITGIEIIV